MRNSSISNVTVWSLAAAAATAALLVGGRARASDGETYSIEQHAAESAVGAPGKASLTVVGKNGWHVNADAPITVSLVADEGIALSKSKMTRGDLVESSKERARFEVGFTSATAGKKKITADTRFVMCQEQACKPVKETVTLTVAIAEPPPATTPALRPNHKAAKASPAKAPAAKAAPAAAGEKASW
jgi:hypothetical protein